MALAATCCGEPFVQRVPGARALNFVSRNAKVPKFFGQVNLHRSPGTFGDVGKIDNFSRYFHDWHGTIYLLLCTSASCPVETLQRTLGVQQFDIFLCWPAQSASNCEGAPCGCVRKVWFVATPTFDYVSHCLMRKTPWRPNSEPAACAAL